MSAGRNPIALCYPSLLPSLDQSQLILATGLKGCLFGGRGDPFQHHLRRSSELRFIPSPIKIQIQVQPTELLSGAREWRGPFVLPCC